MVQPKLAAVVSTPHVQTSLHFLLVDAAGLATEDLAVKAKVAAAIGRPIFFLILKVTPLARSHRERTLTPSVAVQVRRLTKQELLYLIIVPVEPRSVLKG